MGDSLDRYASEWSKENSYNESDYKEVESENEKHGVHVLEIMTLIFGILAILFCCCGGLFAVIGLILGVMAISQGKKSSVTIVGIVCSVVGLLLGLISLMIGLSGFGQEMKEAFVEGFQQGYEATSDTYGDEESVEQSEEYVEDTVESHEGTNTIPDDVAGRVLIDGMEIRIPCKLSKLMDLYEISEYSKGDMEGGLGSYESKSIFFAESGEEIGIFVDVQNYTEKDLADIKDAQIGMISFDSDSGKQIEVFGGLKLGMTEAQVEEVLKDYQYNKSEMSGFVFYNVFAGGDSNYSVSVMMSEGVSINITLYYSGL